MSCLLGVLAIGVSSGASAARLEAQVSFPPDPPQDVVNAIDILGVDVGYEEHDPGRADDDELTFLLSLVNPGTEELLRDGDFLVIDIDLDNDSTTGSAFDGVQGIGAETFIDFGVKRGVAFAHLHSDAQPFRDLVRGTDFTITDHADNDGNSSLFVRLRRSDLGVPRGRTIGIVVASERDINVIPTEFDLAPDAGAYRLGIAAAPERPAVAASAPTAITQTSTMLNGSVDPNRLPTTYFFQYGTTAAYGAQTPTADAGAGDAGVATTATVGGLVPGTTYHLRLVARNAAGETFGPDQSVTTLPLRRNRLQGSLLSPLRCGNGRCALRRLVAGVRIHDPNTGRGISIARAPHDIRLRVLCTRGCTLDRSFRLEQGVARVRAVTGPADRFLGAGQASFGPRVPVPVVRRGGAYQIDLTRLFTDGRGHDLWFRRGAEIRIYLTGPGYAGAVAIIRIQASTRRFICALRDGRPVACRAT